MGLAKLRYEAGSLISLPDFVVGQVWVATGEYKQNKRPQRAVMAISKDERQILYRDAYGRENRVNINRMWAWIQTWNAVLDLSGKIPPKSSYRYKAQNQRRGKLRGWPAGVTRTEYRAWKEKQPADTKTSPSLYKRLREEGKL